MSQTYAAPTAPLAPETAKVVKVIPLPQIPAGSFMSWYMASQAQFNICVTLSDASTTYVNNVCRSGEDFGQLATGFQLVASAGMQLTVSIDSSRDIKVVNQPITVPAENGNLVAFGAVLLFEDSTDNDYNDLYVSIMSWKNKG